MDAQLLDFEIDEDPLEYFTYALPGDETVYTAYPSSILQNLSGYTNVLRDREREEYRLWKAKQKYVRERAQLDKSQANYNKVVDEIKALMVIDTATTAIANAGGRQIGNTGQKKGKPFDKTKKAGSKNTPTLSTGTAFTTPPTTPVKSTTTANTKTSTTSSAKRGKKIPKFLRNERLMPEPEPESATPTKFMGTGRLNPILHSRSRAAWAARTPGGSRRPRTVPGERILMLEMEEEKVKRKLKFNG
ncbi:hypothetical protein ABW20_dc0102299 [Dactylellina cionopaga]|nr:hypothetical protein ABW20_dc0102299 [Dactylellina cionopaga]